MNANEGAQKRQCFIGLIASILGSSLLLFANLIAEPERRS